MGVGEGNDGSGARDGWSTTLDLTLAASFATALPELGVPWQAARVDQPRILALNEPLARELGLDPEALRTDAGVRFLVGNELPVGAAPVAQAYAGHQFGMFAPRLGDGRALLLGELTDAHGAERDLHLKGSGPTPFARADGYAAVGPMLREYLMGEAMHALGIPTTRGLAVVATGRSLARENSFDPVPGAVLVRVASSHLRVGTLQYARSLGDQGLLKRLADFAIARHYPHLVAAPAPGSASSPEIAASAERDGRSSASSTNPNPGPYLGLLDAVVAAQARLVASWMLVGFVHGVMNTDNMTISGETIDFGPCAFIDAYDPAAVFSSIDRGGRYAYGRQPAIAAWNLARLAEALMPLLADDPEEAKSLALAALDRFAEHYNAAWIAGMRAKLGIAQRYGIADADVPELAAGLQHDLLTQGVDYTGAFRALGEAARGDEEPFRALLAGARPGDWFRRWIALAPDAAAMNAVNPIYIPRNHLVDEALEAATAGQFALFERLLAAVSDPYHRRPGFERYEQPAPPSAAAHVTYCGT